MTAAERRAGPTESLGDQASGALPRDMPDRLPQAAHRLIDSAYTMPTAGVAV